MRSTSLESAVPGRVATAVDEARYSCGPPPAANCLEVAAVQVAKRLSLVVVFVAAGLVQIKIPHELARGPLTTLKEWGALPRLGGAAALHAITFALMTSLVWLFTTRIDGRPLADVWLRWGNKSFRVLAAGAVVTMLAG